MRVLHVEPARYGPAARQTIEAVAQVDYVDCSSQNDFQQSLARSPYAAVFLRLGLAFDGAAMDAAPTLRWAVTPTTGLDHIDVAEAVRRRIQVISLRGETAFLDSIHSTAEHTWALLLALERRLVPAMADVAAGGWRRDPFLCGELNGKALGVVGCGRLGRMVAGYGLAFGMRVLVHDHSPEALQRAPAGVNAASLEDLLAQADVVSLHLPLDPSTTKFMSAERLRAMKPGAILINTARGEIVDEPALLEALRSGHLGGAGLDVLAGDGRWDGRAPANHALIAFARTDRRVVISPHLGGYGATSIDRTRRFVAERFAAAVSAAG